MTDATSRPETAYPSGALEFIEYSYRYPFFAKLTLVCMFHNYVSNQIILNLFISIHPAHTTHAHKHLKHLRFK